MARAQEEEEEEEECLWGSCKLAERRVADPSLRTTSILSQMRQGQPDSGVKSRPAHCILSLKEGTVTIPDLVLVLIVGSWIM